MYRLCLYLFFSNTVISQVFCLDVLFLSCSMRYVDKQVYSPGTRAFLQLLQLFVVEIFDICLKRLNQIHLTRVVNKISSKKDDVNQQYII